MDWFMLTAMVIAGWVVVSTFASERLVRQQQAAADSDTTVRPN
jgi:hypothetical protein